jgi:hypothetical protein
MSSWSLGWIGWRDQPVISSMSSMPLARLARVSGRWLIRKLDDRFHETPQLHL